MTCDECGLPALSAATRAWVRGEGRKRTTEHALVEEHALPVERSEPSS